MLRTFSGGAVFLDAVTGSSHGHALQSDSRIDADKLAFRSRGLQQEMNMLNTPANAEEKRAALRRAALEYHEFPTPGKTAIAPTKQ